jgi:hypothetical protein
MSYGGTILIPRSPHGEISDLLSNKSNKERKSERQNKNTHTLTEHSYGVCLRAFDLNDTMLSSSYKGVSKSFRTESIKLSCPLVVTCQWPEEVTSLQSVPMRRDNASRSIRSVPHGNSRRAAILWHCRVCKTKFCAPRVIYQGAHRPAICM